MHQPGGVRNVRGCRNPAIVHCGAVQRRRLQEDAERLGFRCCVSRHRADTNGLDHELSTQVRIGW